MSSAWTIYESPLGPLTLTGGTTPPAVWPARQLSLT
jgi:hypothetical protein